eukprot:scpid100966/ scgid3300/ 
MDWEESLVSSEELSSSQPEQNAPISSSANPAVSSTSIDELPSEVLYLIFRYLPAADLPRVKLVCYLFYDIIESQRSLWRHAGTAGLWPRERQHVSLMKSLASYGNVQALSKLAFAHIYKDGMC